MLKNVDVNAATSLYSLQAHHIYNYTPIIG